MATSLLFQLGQAKFKEFLPLAFTWYPIIEASVVTLVAVAQQAISINRSALVNKLNPVQAKHSIVLGITVADWLTCKHFEPL